MTLETLFRIARWKSEGRQVETDKLVRWAQSWAKWIYRIETASAKPR